MAEEEIVWEEPPGHKRQPAQCPATAAQIAEMKANPKEWMRVRIYDKKTAASPAATRIRRGKYPSLSPANDWEVTARSVEGGSGLWMRYVGG